MINIKLFFLIIVLVFLAEMGDKTQIGLLSLALKHRMRPVFIGAIMAFSLMSLLAVVFGSLLFKIVPKDFIKTIAAILFIALGIFYFFNKDEKQKDVKAGKPILTSFLLVSSAELGDKTQLLVAALALKYNSPILVLTAAIIGLTLASLAGLALVPLIKNKLEWLERFSGLVLVIFGILMLLYPG